MSPEMIENKKYTIKTDIWSLGVLLYELTCLKKPFISRKINSLFEKIKKCKIKKIPDIYSSNLYDLIKSLLQIDEKKRPTTQDIMNNVLIKDRVKKFIESYNKNNNAINSNFNSIERCKTNNILKLKKDFKEKISNFINKNKDNKIINNNINNNINIKNQKFLNTNNSNEKYFEIYSGKNLSVNEPFTLIHNSSYNNFLNITNIRNIHRKNTFVQKNYNKKNYDNDSYELINNYSNKSINKNNNITNINKDNKESKSNNNFNIKLGNKLKFMNIVNNNNNNNIINKKNQIKLPKIKNNINNNNMNFVKLENNKI